MCVCVCVFSFCKRKEKKGIDLTRKKSFIYLLRFFVPHYLLRWVVYCVLLFDKDIFHESMAGRVSNVKGEMKQNCIHLSSVSLSGWFFFLLPQWMNHRRAA